MRVPESTLRLLAHVPSGQVTAEGARELVIGRVLEEGETADLGWLVEEVGEADLGRWLRSRGGRQLSRRSRRFWEAVLETEASAPAVAAEELWPL